MKIKAFVLDDKTGEYEPEPGKKRDTRTLVCVDLDEGDRIESSFRVNVPFKDSVIGDPLQGANLRDSLVDLSITRIAQYESKQLAFSGRVLKVHKGGAGVPTQPAKETKP